MQLAFSSSFMFVVIGASRSDKTDGFETTYKSLYTVGKMMAGFAQEPEVADEHRQFVINIIFMCFMGFCILLLLNMLIAAMSNTYSSLAEYHEQLWIKSLASAMLLMERQSFRFVSNFMNKRCLEYDEDTSRWYLQIQTQDPSS